MLDPLLRAALAGPLLVASAAAQTVVTVPEIASTLPGNAAVSLPLRWSQGRMQVLIEQALLPAGLAGQTVQAIELRRPAFLGEPGYPALQRTVVVRAAITSRTAGSMRPDLAANQPNNLVTVAGPATAQVAATPPHGAGDVLGQGLLTIPLSTPLTIAPGNLFLEFEVQGASFGVSAFHWIDAVHMDGGVDDGYAVPLGNGGCGSGPSLLALRWNSTPPRTGETAQLALTGAPATTLAWVITGLDPQGRAVSGSYLGFGTGLSAFGAPGCHQWTPIDVQISRTTSLLGTLAVSLQYPSGLWSPGQRVGVQVMVLDPAATPAGVALSNGVMLVMDQVGVGPQCATVFAPGTETVSPWAPWRGLVPVLGLQI